MEKSMQHLYDRLEDFPENTCFSINLGFNPDGIPEGDSDARQWAKRISGKAPVLTWDFSLTEGENGIFPHFRFQRLFEQRKREREVDAYSGGICFTMTPLLNALSLYESAHSFINPDDDYNALAKEFYEKTFGTGAGEIVEDLILFEIIPEWGNHVKLDITRQEYHRRMNRFVERVASWQGRINGSLKIYPSAEFHRSELEFFGKIFRDLSADTADFDAIRKRFYDHVYHIYDFLPAHVDSRAFHAANSLIRRFAYWDREDGSVIPGKWV